MQIILAQTCLFLQTPSKESIQLKKDQPSKSIPGGAPYSLWICPKLVSSLIFQYLASVQLTCIHVLQDMVDEWGMGMNGDQISTIHPNRDEWGCMGMNGQGQDIIHPHFFRWQLQTDKLSYPEAVDHYLYILQRKPDIDQV